MAKPAAIINNFTGGELTPLLKSRSDFDKYSTGCQVLENMIVHPHGPVSKRPGFLYVGETKTSSKKSRLIPFRSTSIGRNYLLEFGDLYVRVWWEGYPSYIAEIVSPYAEADLPDLDYAQSCDVMFIAHPGYHPRKLIMGGHTTWSFDYLNNTRGPISDRNEISTLTCIPSVVTGSGTVNFTNTVPFSTTMEKSVVRVDHRVTETLHGLEDEFPYDVNEYYYETWADLGTSKVVHPRKGTWYYYHAVGGSGIVTTKRLQYRPLSIGGYEYPWTTYKTWTGEHDQKGYYFCEYDMEWRFVIDGGVPGNRAGGSTLGCWYGIGYSPSLKMEPDDYVTIDSTHYGILVLQRSWDDGGTWDTWQRWTSPTDSSMDVDTTLQNLVGSDIIVRFYYERINYSTADAHMTVKRATAGYGYIRLGTWISLKNYNMEVLTDPYLDRDVSQLQTQDDLHSTVETWRWWYPAWGKLYYGNGNGVAYDGFPSCVTFFEDRLVFAGSPGHPQTIWMSRSGDYENFEIGPDADHAITIELNSQDIQPIKWLRPENFLMVGTSSGEWKIGASSQGEAVTPGNVSAKLQTTYGSNGNAVKAQQSVLFVSRSGRKVYELTKDWESDGYIADDLTIHSENISVGGLTQVAYQSDPSDTVWFLRADGVLCGLTYMPKHQVYAWHRHKVTTSAGQSIIESIAVIPDDDDGYDTLYAIIKHTINGATKRYIERLGRIYVPGQSRCDMSDPLYGWVDSQQEVYISGGETSATLGHLEGESVQLLTEPSGSPDLWNVIQTGTVSSSKVTGLTGSKACVGLAFTGVAQTMPIETPDNIGTTQGRDKDIGKVVCTVYTANDFYVGPNSAKKEKIEVPSDDYTGDIGVDALTDGFTRDAVIRIEVTDPTPFTLIALLPRIRVNQL